MVLWVGLIENKIKKSPNILEEAVLL